MGAAGFRWDAAKHQDVADVQAIYDYAGLTTEGKKPVLQQEVIDMGGDIIKATEYIGVGQVNEFKYGPQIGEKFNKKRLVGKLEFES